MTSPKPNGVLTLREITWLAILDALERNGGNRSEAARELGIGRTTVHRWIEEMKKGPFKEVKR